MATRKSSDTTTLKIALVGDSDVDRRHLLLPYSGDYLSAIDFCFKKCSIDIDGRRRKLQIYDTAGRKRFAAKAPSLLGDTTAFIFVYSVHNRKSFESVKNRWLPQVQDHSTHENNVLVLVGNSRGHMENPQQEAREENEGCRQVAHEEDEAWRQVTREEACELAEQSGIKLFLEVSDKRSGGYYSEDVIEATVRLQLEAAATRARDDHNKQTSRHRTNSSVFGRLFNVLKGNRATITDDSTAAATELPDDASDVSATPHHNSYNITPTAAKTMANLSNDLQQVKTQQRALRTRLDSTVNELTAEQRRVRTRQNEHEQQHVTLTGRLDEHDKLFNDCQQLHGDEMQQLRRTIDDLKDEMRRMASEHTVIELQATIRALPRCVNEGR